MGDRLARLESSVERMQAVVELLQQRLEVLEAAPAAVAALAADVVSRDSASGRGWSIHYWS